MVKYYKCCCLHCYKSEQWEDSFRIHVHELAYYRVCKCGGRVELISYKTSENFRREFLCFDEFKKHFFPTNGYAGDLLSSWITWFKYEIYQYIDLDDLDTGTIPVPSVTLEYSGEDLALGEARKPLSSSAIYTPFNVSPKGNKMSSLASFGGVKTWQSGEGYTPFSVFNKNTLVDDVSSLSYDNDQNSFYKEFGNGLRPCEFDKAGWSELSIGCPSCGF